MCEDMEKSCDEAVIRIMNKRGYSMESTKSAYGRMLLVLSSGNKDIFSPVSFAENNTKKRVMNIISYRSVALKTGIGLMAACALICIICLINPVRASASSNVPGGDVNNNGGSDASYMDSNELPHAADAHLIETEYGSFWSDTTELVLKDGSDISVISQFPNLTSLTILDIATDNYSPLLKCTGLTHLKIGGFDLLDLSFLEYCPNLTSF